ncbi:MAG: DNA-binding protein WhiA, partial [Clostridia bacterium]|nr:DNA-binding protein WhiA [Clostridia bacterium]
MTFADIARAQMEEARVCECPQPDLRKTCCARNYLRGAFLRVGTVSAGQTGYHMEFSAENLRESTKIRGVLQRFGVKCGETARNKRIGVYVKGEADIAEVLSLCGADGARLQLEETAAARNMNSATQRRVNCDTANAGRTAAASQRVIAAIEALQRKGI